MPELTTSKLRFRAFVLIGDGRPIQERTLYLAFTLTNLDNINRSTRTIERKLMAIRRIGDQQHFA